MYFVEPNKLNLTLKTFFKSDDALQRNWGLTIDFSGKFYLFNILG